MDRIPIRMSEASGVPYYRQIVDQIAQLVRSGGLPAESRLPSVRELAGQLLVSLITVRRAYADLEAAGLIVRRQGQGTFVADEVETASRRQARREGRTVLSQAVGQARRLGLEAVEIRALVEGLLSEEGDGDERR